MTISIALLLAVFGISLILTMVGLGGGLIFSPLFVILGMAKVDAAAASLFLNMIAAASAATTYARKKMVDFSLSIPLILASALAAPVGSYFNVRIAPKPFMIIMAIVLALAGGRMIVAPPREIEPGTGGYVGKVLAGLLIGAVVGLLGGLLGIGGGVFIVPLLIYTINTPTKIAAASSTFIVCFSSLTGFLGYAAMTPIDWRFILPAAIACFAGGQVGSRIMSAGMKGQLIRVIFSMILFLLCFKLLYQSLWS